MLDDVQPEPVDALSVTSLPVASLPVAKLVDRAQAGDRAAEAELCKRLRPAVSAFGRRRLRAREAVDEFQQDVLLLFVEALRRGAVAEPERVAGFVLGICRNVSADRVRQRERRRELWDVYGGSMASALLPEEDLRCPSMDAMKLEDCLAQMSQRARDVVRFGYVEMLSHGELASRLSITETNARVMRHRTLHVLRECMEKPIPWAAATA